MEIQLYISTRVSWRDPGTVPKRLSMLQLAILVSTMHVTITLGQCTTENNFAVSENIRAKNGITVNT